MHFKVKEIRSRGNVNAGLMFTAQTCTTAISYILSHSGLGGHFCYVEWIEFQLATEFSLRTHFKVKEWWTFWKSTLLHINFLFLDFSIRSIMFSIQSKLQKHCMVVFFILPGCCAADAMKWVLLWLLHSACGPRKKRKRYFSALIVAATMHFISQVVDTGARHVWAMISELVMHSST